MERYTNIFLAIGCGLLLWAAWPVSPLTLLVFISWTPLLWIESKVKSKRKFFTLTYIAMFVWNTATTWWILNASVPGALAAFFANSLLMCFPWLGYKVVRKTFGPLAGYISLIAFWMSFEYIHLQDWGLSWPWLTLGNVFATHPDWVQWYEYTGTSGGTLWVLLSNVLVYCLFTEYQQNRRSKSYFILLFSWLLLLVIPSLLLGGKDRRSVEDVPGENLVIVQPNIDPYEKISTGSFEAQISKLIRISESKIDNNTVLVVWPETALYLGNGIEETKMKENYFLNPLWGFLNRHPGITLFTGIESFRMYDSKKTKTARESAPGYYYDAFNGSVLVDSSGAFAYYHKSMLVPGVETLPWFLRFIDKWFEKFGGTTAGYAKQKERTVLDTRKGYRLAPAICYESIYGEFMSKYIRHGANIICIITNDGWWGNTPGYRQHMNYARLRAIESRKWVIRSANTGISCVIDPGGRVIDRLPWNQAGAVKMSVPVNEKKTFFVRNGDILSRVAVVASILFILSTIAYSIKRKLSKQ